MAAALAARPRPLRPTLTRRPTVFFFLGKSQILRERREARRQVVALGRDFERFHDIADQAQAAAFLPAVTLLDEGFAVSVDEIQRFLDRLAGVGHQARRHALAQPEAELL